MHAWGAQVRYGASGKGRAVWEAFYGHDVMTSIRSLRCTLSPQFVCWRQGLCSSTKTAVFVDAMLSFSYDLLSGSNACAVLPYPQVFFWKLWDFKHLLHMGVGEGSLSLSFILPHWRAAPAEPGE